MTTVGSSDTRLPPAWQALLWSPVDLQILIGARAEFYVLQASGKPGQRIPWFQQDRARPGNNVNRNVVMA